MTNTYRSLFSGKEIDEAIIGLRSLAPLPLSTTITTDSNANTIFSFNRQNHNFVKLSIVGLTTTGSSGASYIESNITCSPTTQPNISNRPAVISGTLALAVTVYLDGDNVQVKVSAPIGTTLKVQPIQLI